MTQPATTEPAAATQPPAPTNPPAGEPPAKQEPAKDDKGAGGKEAILADLAKERDGRQALEKQVAALAPLGQLAAALGVKPEPGKTDIETLTNQVAAMQKDLGDERLARMRLEVAAEKELTPAQAARLVGSSREELSADADALKALFPGGAAAATGGQPGTPAPDPSQGARGVGVDELQAQLTEAKRQRNTREVIRLKTVIAARAAK